MNETLTPLHPGAMHQHKTDATVHGWTDNAERYLVHICKCGAAFLFEADLYSAA